MYVFLIINVFKLKINYEPLFFLLVDIFFHSIILIFFIYMYLYVAIAL